MIAQDIFIKSVVVDKVRIRPNDLSHDVKSILLRILQKKFEGICSHHGFIKPGSIKIIKYSMGKVLDVSLNGNVEYYIQYNADICNPAIKSIISAKVTNKNNFGILAECFMYSDNQNLKESSIMEIVIVKSHHTEKDIDFTKIKENDIVNIEILGKKFELNDKKIFAWGRIVKSMKNALLDQVELGDENVQDDIDDIDDKDSQIESGDDLSDDADDDNEKDDDEVKKEKNRKDNTTKNNVGRMLNKKIKSDEGLSDDELSDDEDEEEEDLGGLDDVDEDLDDDMEGDEEALLDE